jgi:diketogulonate reductase-like aldo/keto reductase
MSSILQPIGIGTYKLNNSECSDIITHAINIGYRVIDTAQLYKNHQAISTGINKTNVKRAELFITSKIHINDILNGNTESACHKILTELQIDYVDLLLLHAPVSKEQNIKAWQVLERLHDSGYVRFIGVSNYRINELQELLSIAKIKPFCNQIEISPYNTRLDLVKFCRENKIIIQAYSSLTRGNKLNSTTIIELSKKYKVTPAQLLLKWAIQNDYYVIPKTTNKIHLLENFNVANKDFPIISFSDMAVLNKLNENYYTIKHYRDY